MRGVSQMAACSAGEGVALLGCDGLCGCAPRSERSHLVGRFGPRWENVLAPFFFKPFPPQNIDIVLLLRDLMFAVCRLHISTPPLREPGGGLWPAAVSIIGGGAAPAERSRSLGTNPWSQKSLNAADNCIEERALALSAAV